MFDGTPAASANSVCACASRPNNRERLARFFKIHPGYLVDDPEGYHAELLSDARTVEDKLDLWLIAGAERFHRDPKLCRALLTLARHVDSRNSILLLESILETPSLADRLLNLLRPDTSRYQPASNTAPAATSSPAEHGVEAAAEKEIQMSWAFFYEACFGVGLVLSILLFAGGFGHFHIGHFHAGHLHVGHGHGARAGSTSPFNMFTAMAFLCWFGGSGYLLTHYRFSIMPVVFLLAVVTGLGGAGLIFAFLVKILLPHEHVLLPEDTEMRGVIARVSSSLRLNGTGEVLFSLDGTRRSAAARAENGLPISRDAQVIVVRYEHGIAWVRLFTDLDELDEPQKPT